MSPQSPAMAFFMQKRILMSIGIVIIIVAVLLFLRERFDINLNPLTLINQGQKVSEAVSTITVDRMSGYRKIPQTYINP